MRYAPQRVGIRGENLPIMFMYGRMSNQACSVISRGYQLSFGDSSNLTVYYMSTSNK